MLVLSEFQQLKEVEIHGFIFSDNTKKYHTAACTLVQFITGKLHNIEKLTLDVSMDTYKFRELIDKNINRNVQNLRRASNFSSVEFPSYLCYYDSLTMYTN